MLCCFPLIETMDWCPRWKVCAVMSLGRSPAIATWTLAEFQQRLEAQGFLKHCFKEFEWGLIYANYIAIYCNHARSSSAVFLLAGDAWNLRWGETSRSAVGSTRRFRSLARPATQRSIFRKGGRSMWNRVLFDWSSDDMFFNFFTYEHWEPSMIMIRNLTSIFMCVFVSLLWFCLMIWNLHVYPMIYACKRQVGLCWCHFMPMPMPTLLQFWLCMLTSVIAYTPALRQILWIALNCIILL